MARDWKDRYLLPRVTGGRQEGNCAIPFYLLLSCPQYGLVFYEV